MQLKWCGQSGFLLTSSQGTKILTDPFNKHLGYPVPRYPVDAVTVSHNHYDHNYIRAVPNRAEIPILRSLGEWQIKDINIKSYKSFHDAEGGVERGENLIFIFECDDLRIAHLGDLGHVLPLLECFFNLDVLLIPLGGTYTIGSAEAKEIFRCFQPKLLIPMHYKTATLKYELEDLTVFLTDQERVIFWPEANVTLTKENLPEQSTIAVFQCY